MADRYMDGMSMGIAVAGGDVSRAARAAHEAAGAAVTLGQEVRNLKAQLAGERKTAVVARARVTALHETLRLIAEAHGDDVRRALEEAFRPAFKRRVAELSVEAGHPAGAAADIDALAESRFEHTVEAVKAR